MNVGADLLAKSITGKNSLTECTVAELQRITVQYPYFGPAHFLLAQKLKEEDPLQYEKQFQKTFLYFQNPLWLEYLSGNHSIDQITHLATPGENFSEKKEVKEVEEKTNDVTEVINHDQEPNNVEELVDHPVVSNGPIFENENIQLQENKTEEIASEESIDETGEEQFQPTDEETSSLPPIPRLKIEPIDPASQKFSFEPYHTVDYFASQGIRLNEEEKPVDKFGKQLKSFTEWLKTMKRLPDSAIIAPGATVKDPKVDQLAETSIIEKDVITEAMAEVWEKQGNHEKAIETYRKLSLLNPGKSSYFAAKIEHLKQW